MKISFRLLHQEAFLSLLVIAGLVLCFCVEALVAAYASHEFSYDRDVRSADRIVRFDTLVLSSSEPAVETPDAPGPFKAGMEHVAAPTSNLARAFRQRLSMRGTLQVTSGYVLFVDPEFFDIFDVQGVSTEAKSLVTNAGGLMVTEAFGARLFGHDSPVGKLVKIGSHSYPIVGTVKAPPPNSHFLYDAIALTSSAAMEGGDELKSDWDTLAGSLYGKLKPGATLEDANHAAAVVWDTVAPPPPAGRSFTKNSQRYATLAIPLTSIHFKASNFGDFKPAGDLRLVTGGLLAGAILLVACLVNYASLVSLNAARRGREMAIRRYLGASRLDLVRIFAVQSAAVSGTSAAIGVAMAAALLPAFSQLVGSELSLRDLAHPYPLALLIVIVLLAWAVGTVLPSIHVTRLVPGAALTERSSESRASISWRRTFALAQCGAAAGLIALALCVAAQTGYIVATGQGFTPKGLYHISAETSMESPQMQNFKLALERLPGVTGVSVSSDVPSKGDWRQTAKIVVLPSSPTYSFDLQSVSSEFFKVYGVGVLAGRLFDPLIDHLQGNEPLDKVVLNREGRKALGFGTDSEAVGKSLRVDKRQMEIIGVAADLKYRSADESTPPSVYVNNPAQQEEFTVKVGVADESFRQSIGQQWTSAFPDSALWMSSLSDELDARYAPARRLGRASIAAALIAAAIAFIGVYGLAGYFIRQRAVEIALRKLYGASTMAVVRLVMREILLLAAIGSAIALPIAAYLFTTYRAGLYVRAPISVLPYLWAVAAVIALVTVAAVHQVSAALRLSAARVLNG